jgi:hypothetical protein
VAPIDHATSLWLIGLYMLILGAGLGATQQNLVLAVQNNVDQANIGAASSVVAFFRTLGGAIGVSVFGAILSTQVGDKVTGGLPALIADGKVDPSAAKALGGGGLPDVSLLPAPLRSLFEGAFGDATGHIFLFALPFAAIALVTVCFIKEGRLRTTLDTLEAPETEMDLAAELQVGSMVR